jgi:hypothetical protein
MSLSEFIKYETKITKELNSTAFEKINKHHLAVIILSVLTSATFLAGKFPVTLTFDPTKPLPTSAIKGMIARGYRIDEVNTKFINYFLKRKHTKTGM